jgi:hypothetical protein
MPGRHGCSCSSITGVGLVISQACCLDRLRTRKTAQALSMREAIGSAAFLSRSHPRGPKGRLGHESLLSKYHIHARCSRQPRPGARARPRPAARAAQAARAARAQLDVPRPPGRATRPRRPVSAGRQLPSSYIELFPGAAAALQCAIDCGTGDGSTVAEPTRLGCRAPPPSLRCVGQRRLEPEAQPEKLLVLEEVGCPNCLMQQAGFPHSFLVSRACRRSWSAS